MVVAADVFRELRARASDERAAINRRFFRTGPGQYGEGDRFLGVTVPDQRAVARMFKDVSLPEVLKLLASEWHEARLTALFILVLHYQKGDEDQKQVIIDMYLAHMRYVNNWDLVDSSAYQLLGEHLLHRDRSLLYAMADSPDLWTQRAAIVATYAFIRRGQLDDTFALAEQLLVHSHDLIHKAVGWMLREAGKKDEAALRRFLDAHARAMPRTMLRYSIEKLDEDSRRRYMARM